MWQVIHRTTTSPSEFYDTNGKINKKSIDIGKSVFDTSWRHRTPESPLLSSDNYMAALAIFLMRINSFIYYVPF